MKRVIDKDCKFKVIEVHESPFRIVCVCKECVWNAIHWTGSYEKYENGCYMMTSFSYCNGITTEKEAREKGLI